MSSKTIELQIKENDEMVVLHPVTTVDQVEGLRDQLASLSGGVDYSEVLDIIDDAEQKIGEVSDLLFYTMPVPSTQTYTYTGGDITPIWENYLPNRMTLTGTTTAKNAGTYTATFTPILSAFKWEDTEVSNARNVSWTIAKKAPTTTLSSNTFALSTNMLTYDITVNTDGDGVISAVSADPDKLAVSVVNGNTVRLTGLENIASTSVTITLAEGRNYLGDTFTVTGSVSFIGTLAEASPELIEYVANNDLARSHWAIGDWFPVTLNGTWQCVGNTITLSNYVCRCVLIGINHNAAVEGSHLLHFQMGKNTDGVDIAFNGSKFNTTDTVVSGWSASEIRNTAMRNLYDSILPSNLKAVLKPCVKYTDNTGNGSNTSANVTETSDYCFLLSETEIYGAITYSNSGESSHQQQYEYYANGNAKIRYDHTAPSTAIKNYLRSVNASVNGAKALVANGNSVNREIPTTIYGMSPTFCI